MKSKISIRQLTASEVDVYKKAGINYTVFPTESISIMGSSENFYLKNLNIPIKPNLVDLGPGYGYQDLSFSKEADGITNLSVEWVGTTFYNFLAILGELNIPFIFDDKLGLVFFESKNAKIFALALLTGDVAFHDWLNNRSILSRWFGGSGPDFKTEAIPIREKIRKILVGS